MARRKFFSRIKRDIKNLKILTLFVIGLVLIGSLFCAVAFVATYAINWLSNDLGFSKELALALSLFAIVVLAVLTLATLLLIRVLAATKRQKEIEEQYKAFQISNIDSMTGIEFEYYLQKLISHRGYNVHVTKASGDFGVDLIASNNNEKIAIQAKRHESKVSRRAVSDAVAGMRHYSCNKAMVVTNNYFTPDAITLAQSTGCMLVDRTTLTNWILDYQNSNLQKIKVS